MFHGMSPQHQLLAHCIDVRFFVLRGNYRIFIGRRQMREGGELSLFVDSCYELSDAPGLLSMIRNDRAYQTALRERDGGQMARPSPAPSQAPAQVPAPSTAPAPALAPSPVPQNEGGEHIIRIHYSGKPDSKGFSRLLNFFAYFHGNVPVEVLFESDKSIIRLDDICKLQPDEAILRKLADLVGEENIEMI